MRCSLFAILVLAFNFWGGAPNCSCVVSAQDDPVVSAALRSLFSPRRSPEKRRMGLTQRSFLDLVEQSKPKLEVALVIDGTDSMGPALAGVREALSQMMEDLELYKRNEVAYQLVVFRDAGAPSGVVSFPLNRAHNSFTSDRQEVFRAIQETTAESGAPYFPEMVDEGVHQALTELQWSSGDETTRWIVLFGDAPPFDPALHEEQTGASRQYATDLLVALANSHQVRINCVLCTSRDEDRQAYETVLDQTRAFMNALSTGSGGNMLDLSYNDIRAAMLQADAMREVSYTSVSTIRKEELERVRMRHRQRLPQTTAPLRIAILPHTSFDNMSFACDAPAMQLAAELRMRIKSIPGISVAEPLIVERRFDLLQRNSNYSGLQGTALLLALGRALGADYVLWGNYQDKQGARVVQTRLYDAATGEVIASAERTSSDAVGPDQLCSLLAGDLLSARISTSDHQSLANHFAAVRNDADQQNAVTRLIATSAAHDDLVEGLAALDAALAYSTGDVAGNELLKQAREALERSVQADDTNPLAHFLLASCLYNLARRAQDTGTESEAFMKEFGRALRAAYRFRSSLPDEALRQEIEADYSLLIRGKPAEAIPLYQRLADKADDSDSVRRANWMLAGIYGGDWLVDPQFVDPEKARERLIRILALWPDSAEAGFVKRVLRWDDQRQETRFPEFPKENETLADQVDRET